MTEPKSEEVVSLFAVGPVGDSGEQWHGNGDGNEPGADKSRVGFSPGGSGIPVDEPEEKDEADGSQEQEEETCEWEEIIELVDDQSEVGKSSTKEEVGTDRNEVLKGSFGLEEQARDDGE